jgi:sugar transferase (PEP-CTERM system associated)
MLRVFHHWFSARKLAFFVTEAAAISTGALCGAVVGVLVAGTGAGGARLAEVLPLFVLLGLAFAGIFQFALYALDLYDVRVAGDDRPRGGRLIKAAGAGTLLMGLLALALPNALPAGSLFGGAVGAVGGAIVARLLVSGMLSEPRRLLIVGNGLRARAVANAVHDQGDEAFLVCAMLDPRALAVQGCKPLEEVARDHGAHLVVVACDEMRGVLGADALLKCRLSGIRLYEAAGFCERVLRRIPVMFLRASDLAYADELTVSASRRFIKRAFDLGVSSVLLVLAAPLMVLVALVVKLDSRGPVFYRQERVGLGGRTYHLWKFRSMRTDAEKNGAVWAQANDRRVTRVGRFLRRTRIDEIPQVFNVLAGDMGFVGPRPERPVFVQQLKGAIPFYGLREAVKPGITGWAQIRYPYGASVEDARNKLEFDLYYVKNGSLFLDVAIIFHTVRHVILGRGAR